MPLGTTSDLDATESIKEQIVARNPNGDGAYAAVIVDKDGLEDVMEVQVHGYCLNWWKQSVDGSGKRSWKNRRKSGNNDVRNAHYTHRKCRYYYGSARVFALKTQCTRNTENSTDSGHGRYISIYQAG